MSDFKKRLKRLEGSAKDEYEDVLLLIQKGRYFDELSKAQQARYLEYHRGDESCIKMILYFNGNLHFKLKYKSMPVSETVFRQNVAEIETFFTEKSREYCS